MTVCLAASGLLLAATAASAEDTGGNAKVTAAERSAFCQAQAVKLKLTGDKASEYIAKCTTPATDAARAGAAKLEGTL